MYEHHFGLKRRPFRANATGSDVFVGPHIVSAIAGIKKAISGGDAIATVAGPVGSGKTTLVMKALEAIGSSAKVISIGRMRMNSNDVLDHLLDELGVEDRQGGAIQKFGRFRRQLKEFEDKQRRVCLVVEDCSRLDTDTLAEIEALTAADAGASEGLGVVLMGDEHLNEQLGDPGLDRLQQRTRQRFTMSPLSAAELRGYLRHCFRLSGGDFETCFDENAAPLLHHLSNGVARITNNLVDAAMTATAEQGDSRVSSQTIARIAEKQFNLKVAGFTPTEPMQEKPVTNEAVVTTTPPQAASEVPATPVAPAAVTEPKPEPVAEEPVIAFSDESMPDELPHLIQDTQPELQALTPEPASSAAAVESSLPELELEPETNSAPASPAPTIPVLESNDAAKPDITDDEVPAWERDPTLAELRPDLDALEQAMAFAQGDSPARSATNKTPPQGDEVQSPEIPEITLDHAISQRIENNLIDEPGEISAPEKPTPVATPAAKDVVKPARQSTVELDKIASDLARATSIEDVDDRMAETLFGGELNLAASQFMIKPAIAESANENLDTGIALEPEPQIPEEPHDNPAIAPPQELTLEAPTEPGAEGVDLSASQRLKTVRALNADLHPSLREPETPAANDPTPVVPASPDSIEDQINTSMTQTLKALNVNPPVSQEAVDDDDDDQAQKSGFFARFKRS